MLCDTASAVPSTNMEVQVRITVDRKKTSKKEGMHARMRVMQSLNTMEPRERAFARDRPELHVRSSRDDHERGRPLN